MKYVMILCEGRTEEGFINYVLAPYFANMNIYVTPKIHETKRIAGKTFKGGVSKYSPIKKEIINLCKNPNVLVTTMFDYYGMPSDTPSIDYADVDIYKRIEHIEKAIADDIGCDNLLFNLVVHEFEGLLFSEPQAFGVIANDRAVTKLQAMKDEAETPEHINNSAATAPSKRIESVISDYSKVRQGTIVAKNVGIDKMLSECKHFATWIENIKNFNFSQ